ncbi:hypothetical protein QAD02_012144 [Eretmocerus hayati]|uniref:Uncharacterized protein n=1 Tax=Eretmocerus hayati TaxID=131215 RepID=A0ACC2NZ09_9HYME|nr:hypothetical protein QAD02_012144 [Eretmocerus hayati]
MATTIGKSSFSVHDHLMDIVERGEVDAIIKMLENGLDPDYPICQYGCLLNAAIVLDRDELIDPLLHLYANVNVSGYMGKTSVSLPVIKGKQDIVQKLLWYGADIEIQDYNDNCLLGEAIRSQNYNIVVDLIQASIDIFQSDSSMLYGCAAQLALTTNQLSLMETLINLGDNLAIKDICGKNILDFCVECFQRDVFSTETTFTTFQYLMSQGARVSDMRHYPYINTDFFMHGNQILLNMLLDIGLRFKLVPDA